MQVASVSKLSTCSWLPHRHRIGSEPRRVRGFARAVRCHPSIPSTWSTSARPARPSHPACAPGFGFGGRSAAALPRV